MQPNPNYEAEARRKQEERDRQRFQQARDPFQYGRQVAQRRYSEIMSGLAERQRQSARTYSDMYQAAKETATAQRAMGGPSLSGGMKAQYSDLVSAREMQALGTIGRDREAAAREIDLQRQAAFANAELEGQQASQTELQNRQTKLQLIQQKNEILVNKDLDNEQKAEQLRVLGYEKEAQELLASPESGGANAGLLGAGLVTAGTYTIAKVTGLSKAIATKLGVKAGVKTLGGKLLAFGKVGLFVLALGAILYGLEKFVFDTKGDNQSDIENAIDDFFGVKYDN